MKIIIMTTFHLFVLVFTSIIFEVHSVVVKRYRTNAALYGGYNADYKKVLFTNSDIEDWKNLTSLAMEAGLQEKAIVCSMGDGAWLAYPDVDFKTDPNHSSAKILIGEVCIPADFINSVQPIGSINKKFIGLYTYSGPYFSSSPKLMSSNDSNETSTSDGVASLISSEGYFGHFMVEGGGKTFCVVRPKGVITTGICILPDLETEFGIKEAKITLGCNGNDLNSTIMTYMQTCFRRFGAYRVMTNYLKLPVLTSICSDSADAGTKVGFQKLVEAWKYRMSPTQKRDLNPANIDKDREDPLIKMRLEILRFFFQIFRIGCSGHLPESGLYVPDWYFSLIRFLYMHHLKSIWEEAPQSMIDRNDTNSMWSLTHQYLKSCHAFRLANPVTEPHNIRSKSCGKPQLNESPDPDWEADVLDLLLEGDELDHVVEQVWIMLNYVSPYCAVANTLSDNMWVEFTSFFRRQFLLPLLQQWVNPGTWQVYYEYMFNGLPIETGKRRLIACVQNALRDSPVRAEPVGRPSALVKDFLNLSKKRPPVETPTETGKVRQKREIRKGMGRSFPSARHLTEDAKAQKNNQSHMVHHGKAKSYG